MLEVQKGQTHCLSLKQSNKLATTPVPTPYPHQPSSVVQHGEPSRPLQDIERGRVLRRRGELDVQDVIRGGACGGEHAGADVRAVERARVVIPADTKPAKDCVSRVSRLSRSKAGFVESCANVSLAQDQGGIWGSGIVRVGDIVRDRKEVDHRERLLRRA